MAAQVYIGTRAKSITPADGSDLAYPNASIYIGGNGNIKVTTEEGDVVTFVGVVAGTILPVSCKRVWSASTTATNLVAIW
jgi:hypothetical protein